MICQFTTLSHNYVCLFHVPFFCRRSEMTVSILAGFVALTCLGKVFQIYHTSIVHSPIGLFSTFVVSEKIRLI